MKFILEARASYVCQRCGGEIIKGSSYVVGFRREDKERMPFKAHLAARCLDEKELTEAAELERKAYLGFSLIKSAKWISRPRTAVNCSRCGRALGIGEGRWKWSFHVFGGQVTIEHVCLACGIEARKSQRIQ